MRRIRQESRWSALPSSLPSSLLLSLHAVEELLEPLRPSFIGLYGLLYGLCLFAIFLETPEGWWWCCVGVFGGGQVAAAAVVGALPRLVGVCPVVMVFLLVWLCEVE